MTVLSSKRASRAQGTSVSITLIPVKSLEQLALEIIFRHLKDKKIIRNSQHGFAKRKLNKLNYFLQRNDSTDGWRAVDIVHIDLSEVFASRKTFIDKLLK